MPHLTAMAWNYAGAAQNLLGNTEEAIRHFGRAMRLSSRDPFRHVFLLNTAMAMLQAGRHDEALDWARRGTGERPGFLMGGRIWIIALALTGRLEEARQAMVALLSEAPHQRGSPVGRAFPEEFRLRCETAYRLAAMPG